MKTKKTAVETLTIGLDLGDHRHHACGVDPLAYLRDVLRRLPTMTTKDDLSALLPVNWQPV